MIEIVFWKYNGGKRYSISSYKANSNETLGIHIGDNTVSSLLSPAPMKEDITNESRAENGTRYISVPYMASRDVTIDLVITGNSRKNHNENLMKLMDILNVGHVAVSIPYVYSKIYFLEYKSCQSYAVSRSGMVSKLSIKFKEYNPQITHFNYAKSSDEAVAEEKQT